MPDTVPNPAGTVNVSPLLAVPFTVTTTGPVVARFGTGTTILLMLQDVGLADVPLKVIVPFPLVFPLAPNPVPLTVTNVLVPPELGVREEITGTTAKLTELLATPPTVTTTGPVVAAAGTVAVMLAELQLVTVVAGVPLNVTVLEPCVEPNPLPAIVTDAPTAPEFGVRLVIDGPAA
jgi:hypothetical protein